MTAAARLFLRVLFLATAVFTQINLAQTPPSQSASAPPASNQLSVARIFSLPSLNGALTQGLAYSSDGKKLAYLNRKGVGNDATTELWSIDIATGERSLLVSADKLASILPAKSEKQSQATRLGRRAPSQYQWSPAGDALLFQGPNSLAWFDLKSQSGKVLVSGEKNLADPKISPDGQFVSFIRDHNLWLVGVADAHERALTTDATDQVRKGELDWVYPEELGIFTAYWWSPDSSSVAYLEIDERNVNRYPLVNFESPEGEADQEPYPVPGGKNPIVHVLVAAAKGGASRRMDTGSNDDVYIPRVAWLPDSKRIAIQRLNREQNNLDLLFADAATGKSSVILNEKDKYWINISDDFRFFKDGKRFLWSSERTGYRHLYLYDITGKELAQLTKGNWEVSHVLGLEESRGLVYFTSPEKSPLERHLYSVALDGSGFNRITKQDGTHDIQLAHDAESFIDTYSNSATPPRQDLYRVDGSSIAVINENRIDELAQYHLQPVEFFTVKSHDGVDLNCSMIKPPNFDPAKKYPVLIYTYGGPHAQIVVNAWTGANFLWHQVMAQKGYIIFSLDNRGSAGRGHVFEEPVHYRLGAQEASDQRDGVRWLAHQSYIDANRVGIWGGSYGGHMTLHAMLRFPEVFKVGFAAAPITDWHYYDTIYTERYLGLLPLHEEDYQESSPHDGDKLKGKLMIAHGTGDDNVHYANTLAFVDDAIKAGIYVEVMSFPGRGHGIGDPAARRIMMERAMQFFLDNL
jgi:dipeptidyl-peptidase 4